MARRLWHFVNGHWHWLPEAVALDVFLQGALLSFGLILAIGAQNAFVLRQGLRGEHVLLVSAVCAFSDAALIGAGVAGFGVLVERAPWIEPVFRYGGAAFLLVYAFRAFRSALAAGSGLVVEGKAERSWRQVLLICLAFTWLNPHVYLDTLVLLGAASTAFGDERLSFAFGAMTSSFVFFFSLGFGARLLQPVFAKPVAWRWLDGVIAIVMLAIAISLLRS